MTASGVVLLGLTNDTSLARLITAYVLFGLGFGMVNAPITNAAVSGMPLSQAGVAAAVASTSRQVGSALGVAILGSVVIARIVGPIADGFAAASQIAWVIVIGCGVLIFALGLASTTAWARRTAERTAALFTVAPASASLTGAGT